MYFDKNNFGGQANCSNFNWFVKFTMFIGSKNENSEALRRSNLKGRTSMKKLLMPSVLVWLLGLTGCGDTGIYGTFQPADRLGLGFDFTIQIAGRTA